MSMNDIIFLLLIFFMLTSNIVTPSGMPVSLPSSKSTNAVIQKISVTITPELQYFVNDKAVAFAEIEPQLVSLLQGTQEGEGVIVLHVDKSVPVEHLVKVASIATELKAKVTLATVPTE